MTPDDLTRFLDLLHTRRDALEAESAMGELARKPVELDQTTQGRLSRMDAMQNQAMAQATERRRKAELLRIEEAFRRAEEGEYGYCQACGEEIALRRLEIDPATSLCVVCAGKSG